MPAWRALPRVYAQSTTFIIKVVGYHLRWWSGGAGLSFFIYSFGSFLFLFSFSWGELLTGKFKKITFLFAYIKKKQ